MAFSDSDVREGQRYYIRKDAEEACMKIEKLIKHTAGQAKERLQAIMAEIKQIADQERDRLWDERKKTSQKLKLG